MTNDVSEPTISVTPAAVDAISRQLKKRATSSTGSLRLGVKGGGCSGFSYVIEFHDGDPGDRDTVFDLVATDGAPVRVLVDSKSMLYLDGMTLEWEQTLMRQGFKFNNPNEKSACGCGTSFSF